MQLPSVAPGAAVTTSTHYSEWYRMMVAHETGGVRGDPAIGLWRGN